MFQKTNEERKNQNHNKDKIYISRDESERNFNYNNSFIRFNFKKYCNLNEKKHETKNEQTVEKTLLQRICNIMSKIKKQHKLIRKEETLRKLFEKQNIDKKSKKFLRFDRI